MPFDLGDAVRLQADCTDPGGTLTNAATATLTITLPDGTTTTPAVTNPPAQTGRYSVDYTTVHAGRHLARWVFGTPASAYTDQFDVREAAPPLIMSLADAKKHLNKTATTTDDDEIRAMAEAVTAAVEWFVGPVAVRTVTETHDFTRAEVLALRQVPALSLTSVVPVLTDGTTYDVDDLDLDEAGIVRRKDGGLLYGPLRVTYPAGRRIVTANITLAGKIILQHLWRTQQGPGRPQRGVQDYDITEPIPGLGYAIPNRAMQLLSPDELPPGMA